MEDNLNNQKSNKNSEFKIEDILNVKECTSTTFGDYEINQEIYYCTYCDKMKENKLCRYCYINCHHNCREEESKYKIENELEERKIETFYCSCGIKYKHKVKEIESKKFNSCTLSIIDDKFINGMKYFCEDHKITICSICSFVCHNGCKLQIKQKNGNFNNSKCECKNIDSHSSFNEFAFTINLNNFKSKINVSFWPIQFINLMFNSKDTLFLLEKEFLDSYQKSEDELTSNTSNFGPLLEVFSDIFNREFKTYYYHNKILNIFPLDKIIQIMNKIQIIDSRKKALIKFRLMYIFIYVHLKKDFSGIKELTSIDFLMNNILNRLKYRNFIYTKSIYTTNIFDKYNVNNSFNILHNIIFDSFLPFMEKGIKIDLLNIYSFQDELEIGLKLISFCLKRCIFNLNELQMLIEGLNNFNEYFINNIKYDTKNECKNWVSIFQSFAEIFYMIAVSYNDLVVYEYLNNDNKLHFIHTYDNYGQILYKMIMRSLVVLNYHYVYYKNDYDKFINIDDLKNNDYNSEDTDTDDNNLKNTHKKYNIPKFGILNDKTINLFHESLKILYLSDNKYYYQMKSITDKDLNEYNYEINNLKELVNYNNPCLHIVNEIEKILEQMYINCVNYTSSNLSMQIEGIYDEFNDSIFNNINEYINDNLVKEKDENILNYQKEIIKKYKNNFYFLTKNEDNFNFNKLISLMKYSSIDNISLKLIIFISDENYPKLLTFEILEKVLSLISLFFLSSEGMSYLLLGKTFSRLIKIFKRYSCINENYNKQKNDINLIDNETNEILYEKNTKIIIYLMIFLEKMFKGIKLYKIDLTSHKFLKEFYDVIFEHLQGFIDTLFNSNELDTLIHKSNSQYTNLEYQLNLIVSIFTYIRPFYSDDDKNKINLKLLSYFLNEKLKLFRPDIFYNNFIKNNLIDDVNMNDLDNIISNPSYKTLVTNNPTNTNDNNEDQQLLLKENKNNIINTGSNINTENEDDSFENMNIKLTFTIYKMITQFNTIITKDNYNKIKNLFIIFDMKNESTNDYLIFKLFKETKINYYYKNILINVMQKLFFFEIYKLSNFSEINKSITSEEYFKYYFKKDNLIDEEEINDLNNNEINDKLLKINRIEMLIKIYILELNTISNKSTLNLNEYNYLLSLLKGIKFISDYFYYERNIWNKPIISFYSLVLLFLKKTKEILILLLDKEEIEYNITDIEKELEELEIENKINKLIDLSFNLFDKDSLYIYISTIYNYIYKKTNINKEWNLSTFLNIYDNIQEFNFTPFSLIEEKDYEYFYEENDEDENDDEEKENLKEKLEILINKYTEDFIDINNTVFLVTIQEISNENSKYDYRQNLVNYLNFYLNSDKFDNNFESLLCIITKSCFYDTDDMQKCFEKLNKNQLYIFFNNFSNLIQHYIYLTFVYGISLFDYKIFLKIANITKLTLQLIQLLGEDFCGSFHNKIFKEIKLNEDRRLSINYNKSNKNIKSLKKKSLLSKPIYLNKNKTIIGNNNSIFHNVILSLKEVIKCIYLSNNIKTELPLDKLVVLLTNLVDFIIEFLVTEFKDELETEISDLLFNGDIPLIKILIMNIECKDKYRMEFISYVKLKFINLIHTYIKNEQSNSTINLFLQNNFNPIKIFNEIIENIKMLIITFYKSKPNKILNLLNIKNNDSFVEYLIHLYVYNNDFRESLFLLVALKLFILIEIFENQYHNNEISEHFQKKKYEIENIKNNNFNQQNNYILDEENNLKLEDNWNMDSINSYRIYLFMKQLVLRVEIKNSNKEKEEDKSTFTTFFIRPYLTYYISKQSILSFENNVGRDMYTEKFIGLINFSDYALFEMVANRSLINAGKLNKFLVNIQYEYLEIINYLFILGHNIVLIIRHYKKPSLDVDEYNLANTSDWYNYDTINLIVAIIQIVYILCVLFIWFKFKFFNYLENCLLEKSDRKFIFRNKEGNDNKKISKNVRDFFNDENSELSVYDLFKEVNKDVPIYEMIKTICLNATLLNREISVFFLNIITLILYLSTKSAMFLVLSVLFIANLSPTLFAIFKALINKGLTLVTVLSFVYLFCYFFGWIAYYFLSDYFIFSDVLKFVKNPSSDLEFPDNIITTDNEGYCYSPLQCWLFITNYGIRQGGGIADSLKKASFRTDVSYFLVRFFFDMLYHLFVVLILLNVFLGIIVDAFADLRNNNWNKENDMKNVCFICQETRDGCLSQNIDFDEHVLIEHNMWNYVYYLTYLHINNVLDFDHINKMVWDDLGKQDYGWLPLKNN